MQTTDRDAVDTRVIRDRDLGFLVGIVKDHPGMSFHLPGADPFRLGPGPPTCDFLALVAATLSALARGIPWVGWLETCPGHPDGRFVGLAARPGEAAALLILGDASNPASPRPYRVSALALDRIALAVLAFARGADR
jgi:hypothetical protein